MLIEVLLILAASAVTTVAAYRRWGLAGALAVPAAVVLAEMAWGTAAWMLPHSDASTFGNSRALIHWGCHSVESLPVVFLLGLPGVAVLHVFRRALTEWWSQLSAMAITYGALAFPTVLAMIWWSIDILSCDTL